MPGYPHLARTALATGDIAGHPQAHAAVRVPYTEDMPANARAHLVAQADPAADTSGLIERYGEVPVGSFDGDATRLTEMDALVAYLQMLGTTVDFTSYEPLSEENRR